MGNKGNSIVFLALLLAVILSGCKKIEFKYPKQLMGDWTIAHSERAIIYSDGSVTLFEDQTNAGTLSVYEPSPPAETFKEFEFSYTNFEGQSGFFHSYLYTDEGGTRIFFSKILCDSPFQCDIVWTVEKNEKNKQVWAAYGTADAFFYPPDQFDPSNDAVHLVWRITLTRN